MLDFLIFYNNNNNNNNKKNKNIIHLYSAINTNYSQRFTILNLILTIEEFLQFHPTILISTIIYN